MGEAYWSLADLKNYVFSDAEIAAMQSLLKGEGGDDEDQAHLHFALGRAFEHKKDYAHGLRSLCDRQSPAAQDRPLRHRSVREQDTPRARMLRRGILRRPIRLRMSRSRAHLHRRPAAFGLDAGRADPRQPFERRGHFRAAEPPHHRAGVRPRQSRRTTPIRKSCAPHPPEASRRSAGATSRRPPRCAADGRTSSTRCRTISATWA